MLAYLFVVIAVAFRFIPHPWGFTPAYAALLFFGAKAPRRMFWVPLALMIAGDLLLTKLVYQLPMHLDQWVIWAWYAGILWLGTALKDNQKPVRVVLASLTTSVSFFVITNFVVWEARNLYPHTFAGLVTCFTLAIPFFARTASGDLVFTALMFATPYALHLLLEAFEKDDHIAAA